MRFLAVAMAVLLGTAVASAQSDPKLQTAAAKPKPETTGKGPPKRAGRRQGEAEGPSRKGQVPGQDGGAR